MTPRERLLSTIHQKQADKIPFVTSMFAQRISQAQREARNKGMALAPWKIPCMHRSMPNVKVSTSTPETSGKKMTRITYETSVGTVWLDITKKAFAGAGYGTGDMDLYGISSPQRGDFVKKPKDWDVLQYMAEDIQCSPYEDFENRVDYFKQVVGEDGIIDTSPAFGHSPYQTLLIDWVGAVRLYIDHVKHPNKVEDVLEALTKSQEKSFPIAVKAGEKTDIVHYGDHIDDKFVSPNSYEKYILPIHNKFCRMAHDRGLITRIHCDGKLDGLKHLIAKTEHDIIHAITPPPVGNLSIKEALELWKDKILWVNYEYHFMGVDAMKKHLFKLLRSIIPGYRVIMDASTERWVPLDCLRMFAEIMSKVTLPLTEEKINKIERSV
jgi:hypothetical protein